MTPSPALQAVSAAAVLTMTGEVLSPGTVIVAEGRIVELRSGPAPTDLVVERGGPRSVLLPGFVSAHTHLAFGLSRHVADDAPFFEWILSGILPTMQRAATIPDFYIEGARRSAGDLLRSGVTTVADNFVRTEGVRALQATGQRGIFFQEVFGSQAEDEQEYQRTLGAELDRLPDVLKGFSFGYSPHTPWSCPRSTFLWIAARARQEGRRLSFHLAESLEEKDFFEGRSGVLYDMMKERDRLNRYDFGQSVTRYLHNLGLLGEDVVVAHAVQVDAEDIAILAKTGTSVVHCPTSNMKLCEGMAPVVEMLEAGVPLALGLDSAASTGRLDFFEEMRRALLVQRGRTGRVGPMTASRVLDIATRGGAHALGLSQQIGTLEVHRRADLLLVEPDDVGSRADPEASVVLDAGPENVALVMIDGVVRWRRRRDA